MASEAAEIARARALVRSGRARAIRVRAGVTREELARSVGVDGGTVGRWEAGTRSPRGEAAKRLARVLRELEEVAP